MTSRQTRLWGWTQFAESLSENSQLVRVLEMRFRRLAAIPLQLQTHGWMNHERPAGEP
jgi:hypothetical protein